MFYFAKSSIDEAQKNSLAIAISLYQRRKNKTPSQIPNKTNIQGSNWKGKFKKQIVKMGFSSPWLWKKFLEVGKKGLKIPSTF